MARQGELNGFLDEGCLVEGSLTFQDTLRIDGKVKGNISSANTLVVGPSGVVEGEVKVGILQVSGTIIGSVQTKTRITVHQGGRLFADIATPALVIEEGAVFQGKCSMGSNENAEITPIRQTKGSR